MLEGVHHIAYVVNDMEDAIRIFRDVFGLSLSDRRVLEGQSSVEIATFQCGTTLIELMRPINHPQLMRFLEEHGPGLHHVAFAMGDISKGIDELRSKGVFAGTPFVAPTGWKIAYFDFEKSSLDLLQSCHHGDHLAETGEKTVSGTSR